MTCLADGEGSVCAAHGVWSAMAMHRVYGARPAGGGSMVAPPTGSRISSPVLVPLQLPL